MASRAAQHLPCNSCKHAIRTIDPLARHIRHQRTNHVRTRSIAPLSSLRRRPHQGGPAARQALLPLAVVAGKAQTSRPPFRFDPSTPCPSPCHTKTTCAEDARIAVSILIAVDSRRLDSVPLLPGRLRVRKTTTTAQAGNKTLAIAGESLAGS